MDFVQYDVRVIRQCFSGNQLLQKYTSRTKCYSCVVVSFDLESNLLNEVNVEVRIVNDSRVWKGREVEFVSRTFLHLNTRLTW